jgi:putative transposase
LDDHHLWIALRYAELNPVRAGMVATAALWPWSSAAIHCGSSEASALLEMEVWKKRWTSASWSNYLASGETKAALEQIRQCTHTGRPLGSTEFVHSLEESTHRCLTPHKGGRPASSRNNRDQASLTFENQ